MSLLEFRLIGLSIIAILFTLVVENIDGLVWPIVAAIATIAAIYVLFCFKQVKENEVRNVTFFGKYTIKHADED